MSSPESTEMTRYGLSASDNFTGAMKNDIFIYHYKDPDFNVPISLSYHFDGFRPNQSSGTIGYGWFLNVGGAITRESRGIRDEHRYGEGQTINDCAGYYYFMNSGNEPNADIVSVGSGLFSGGPIQLDKAIPAYLYGSRPAYIWINGQSHLVNQGNYVNYETSPDIFHFNILGKQGDFTISGANGACSAYSCDGAHGDYDITFQAPTGNTINYQAQITIIDGLGTRYIFGGDVNHIDYVDNTGRLVGVEEWPATAWKLKEIIAPSGRKMEFIYGTAQVYAFTDQRYETNYIYGSNSVSYNDNAASYYKDKIEQSIYVVSRNLTQIKVDGKLIADFLYTSKTYDDSEFNIIPNETTNVSPKRLCEIRIFNFDGDQIEAIRLGQSFSAGENNCRRMFLTSLQSRNNGIYSFSYDDNYTFPKPSSKSIDHWGFWNGKMVSDPCIPVYKLSDQDESLYNLNSTEKDADFEYSKRGALTKIVYPTGGKSEIEYESHQVSKRWNKSLNNIQGIPEECPPSFKVGGVRVKCIRNISEILQTQISFQYENGVLTQMPRYVFAQKFHAEGISLSDYNYYGALVKFDIGSFYSNKDHHVVYAKVRENYDNNSKKEYEYYSFDDYPDEYLYSFVQYPQIIEGGGTLPENHSINAEEIVRCMELLLPPSADYSYVRGKLKSVSEYDSFGTLKEKREYIYDIDEGLIIPAKCNVILGFKEIAFTHIYPHLKKIKTTQYFDDGRSKTWVDNNAFNSDGRLSITESSSSNETDIRRKYYRYCGELTDNYQGKSYWPGLLKDEVHSLIRDSLEYVTMSQSYEYDNEWGEIRWPISMPARIISYNMDAPCILLDRSTVFSTGRSGWASVRTISYDTLYYRPVRIQDPSFDISLTWDDSFKNIINRTVDGHRTLYEWKDGVGITRITRENGSSRAYVFDNKGRLSSIKNTNGDILQSFVYKFKTDMEGNPLVAAGENHIQKTNYISTNRNNTDIELYDELGYIKQGISVNYGGMGKHKVTPYVYDNFRRVDSVSYLPYVTDSSTVAFRTNALSEQKEYYRRKYNDTCAFVLKEYESRHATKVRSIRKAGKEYVGPSSGHKTRYEYSLNDENDGIHHFILEQKVKQSLDYPEGALLKVRQVDEDGCIIEQYSDGSGKAICDRRFISNTQVADVYYIYDTKDSLACVIQPEGISRIENEFDLDSDFAQKYCYVYKRDGKGRLITYSIPGGGKIELVYDNKDRVILKSTSELLNSQLWEYYTYDNSNRLLKSILVSSTYSPSELRHNILYGAPLQYLITNRFTLAHNSYYDTADSLSYGLLKNTIYYEVPNISSQGPTRGSLSKTVNYFYDSEGRPSHKEEIFSNGKSILYDFTWNQFDLLEYRQERQIISGNISTEYKCLFQYDNRGRVLLENEYIDNQLLSTVSYSYDDNGELLHISCNNETIKEDYGYNIRGQLVSHNLKGNNNLVFSQNNEYSLGGRIHSRNILHQGVSPYNEVLGYDKMGRLISSSRFGSYSYDLNSNLTDWESPTGFFQSYSHNGNHLVGSTYNNSGQVVYDERNQFRLDYNTNSQVSSVKKNNTENTIQFKYFSDGELYSNFDSNGNGRIYRGSFVYTHSSSGSDTIESISALHGRICSEDAGPNYIYYSKDQSESNLVLLNASNAQIREQNLFTDYGRNLPDTDCQSLSSNRYRYAGKEIVKNPTLQTPYINYGPRWYSPNDSRWMSPDGKAYLYPHLSPYSFCGADPINFKDPSGLNPIYSPSGKFLGTDNLGLTGDFYIIKDNQFTQSMNHYDALQFNIKNEVDPSILEIINSHYFQLNKRPDYDGYITLIEANDWYRNGKGQALFADFEKIYINKDKIDHLKEKQSINLFKMGKIEEALVYGNITIYIDNNMILSNPDIYDFDKHSGKFKDVLIRNLLTAVGKIYAGKGISYKIYFYGKQEL
ncbi:MAG: RHS repeat-associated core domain-containing protein [Candidatus Cryptobacteroides sp.]